MVAGYRDESSHTRGFRRVDRLHGERAAVETGLPVICGSEYDACIHVPSGAPLRDPVLRAVCGILRKPRRSMVRHPWTHIQEMAEQSLVCGSHNRIDRRDSFPVRFRNIQEPLRACS